METIIAAGITAVALVCSPLIAILVYAHNTRLDITKEDRLRTNQVRRDLYEAFSQQIYNVFDSTKSQRSRDEEERHQQDLLSTFREFRSKIILYGSDEVVRAFNEWDPYNQESNGFPPQELLVRVLDILIAIRKDLGYDETTLSRIEVAATFLSDPWSIEESAAKERTSRFADSRSL